jgi:5-methylcytosine-specific restriction endonuclease McrA
VVDGALPSDHRLEKLSARFTELSLPRHLQDLTRRLWEADHTIPVVEGGGDCGPENLRTLCWACHRAETAKLKKRLARLKKEAVGAT